MDFNNLILLTKSAIKARRNAKHSQLLVLDSEGTSGPGKNRARKKCPLESLVTRYQDFLVVCNDKKEDEGELRKKLYSDVLTSSSTNVGQDFEKVEGEGRDSEEALMVQ